MPTELIYMREMQQLTCSATVIAVEEADGKTIVVLDQTVFYPQGGGQPFDQGKVTSADAEFIVEDVRFADGEVKHIGRFTNGTFTPGQTVTCEVDAERRALMSRLHSAGHAIDMAIHSLGMDWTPGKGFHFPSGPYVEYEGNLTPEEAESLRIQIETTVNKLIGQGLETRIEFMPKEAMGAVCRYVPEYLPEGKPARVVFYGQYAVPCGGTHVTNLADIGKIQIRKVKAEKGRPRVSYELEANEKRD